MRSVLRTESNTQDVHTHKSNLYKCLQSQRELHENQKNQVSPDLTDYEIILQIQVNIFWIAPNHKLASGGFTICTHETHPGKINHLN